MKPLQLKSCDEISYIILRSHHNELFYFNDDGVIESIPKDNEQILIDKRNVNNKIYVKKRLSKILMIGDLLPYIVVEEDAKEETKYYGCQMARPKNLYSRFPELKYMVGQIQKGMTYDDVQKLIDFASDFRNKNGTYSGLAFADQKGIDAYIARCNPIILKDPDNPKAKTFDIIKVQVNLITSKEDRWDYIKKHQRDLVNRAIESIAQNKQFQKFGVPVNILRCTKIHSLSMYAVELVFELKNIGG